MRSGFKTLRDVLLFALGAAGCVYHMATAGDRIQIEVLLFFGGLAGSPYVLGRDEKQ